MNIIWQILALIFVCGLFIWIGVGMFGIWREIVVDVTDKRLVQWEPTKLHREQIEGLVERVKSGFPNMGDKDLKDKDYLADYIKKRLKVWDFTGIALCLSMIVPYYIIEFFGWWNPITAAFDAGGRWWNTLFGADAWIVHLPLGIPLALHGTCGLLIAMAIGRWVWPANSFINERLGGAYGVSEVFDKQGRRIGQIYPPKVGLTQARHIDDEVVAILCRPKKPIHYNRFVHLCEFVHGVIPHYTNPELFWPGYYLIITKKDSMEPKNNYNIDDIHLQDDIWDSELFIEYETGWFFKVFTCGFKPEIYINTDAEVDS